MVDSSSIDDLLTGTQSNSHQPATPESIHEEQDRDIEDIKESEVEINQEPEEPELDEKEPELDDYGNEKSTPKTYTEDEVNERINKAVRDRLARMEKNQSITPQQAQNAEQNFEYNPDSEGDWQQQLKQFVKQTYQETIQEQHQQQAQLKEQQAQAEFETKFHTGMSKFNDFVEVVSSQPITDAMTIATRSMKDPAAFLYAASKKHGAELQRIAQIPDQYAQMVEIGKLEERMRKNKSPSNAPRPLGKTPEDSAMPYKSDRQPSIEELIANAEAKKRKILNARRR